MRIPRQIDEAVFKMINLHEGLHKNGKFLNEAMTMKKFYDKEEDAKDADTPEHSFYLRIHGYRTDSKCPSNFQTSLQAEHFRKHHNIHIMPRFMKKNQTTKSKSKRFSLKKK